MQETMEYHLQNTVKKPVNLDFNTYLRYRSES